MDAKKKEGDKLKRNFLAPSGEFNPNDIWS